LPNLSNAAVVTEAAANPFVLVIVKTIAAMAALRQGMKDGRVSLEEAQRYLARMERALERAVSEEV
jgi:hypothetical protein